MPKNDHLDPNDLAALAEGVTLADAPALQCHLAQCRSCLAAYAEAVRVAHTRALRPGDFAVPPDLLGVALAAGRRPRTPVRARPLRWRPAAAALVAVGAIALAVIMLQGPQGGRLGRDDIAMISQLVADQSVTGPLLPGVVTAEGLATAPVYRSGATGVPQLERVLREAARGQGSSPRNARQAYWLSAGHLAVGQVGTAADLVRLARQSFPQDQPLLVLEGITAYRASELGRAESLLREALRRDPADAVARFDLAVVLVDAGRGWEARQLISAGSWPAGSDVARRAVAMADSLP